MNKYSKTIENIFSESIAEKRLNSLFKILKNKMKDFRTIYRKIVFSTPSSQMEQILYDNYYIIEKICKLLLKENGNASISVSPKKVPLLGDIILKSCEDGNIPETGELVEIINALQEKTYISNMEFELLVWSFRFSIIIALHDLYISENSDKSPALDYIILLSKSDTFNLKEINASCNPLEKLYGGELCGVYSNMDETTRQLYRYRTSKVAYNKEKSEIAIAKEFLSNADEAFSQGKSSKEIHVGYFIYKAYGKLTRKLSPKLYVQLIAGTAAALSMLFTFILRSYWLWAVLFFPFWEFSKLLVEIVFTESDEVTYLPRMDFNNEVPPEYPTLMVISTLLTAPKDINHLKEKLIRLHFSNLSENIKICALCDLKKASLPSVAEDKALVRNALRTIKKLNEIYNDRFVLVIRKRTFSKTQQEYTGFERKRGAIEQLVKLINGENIEFLSFCGDLTFVRKVKYIAALDYDTKALIDTIPELVSIAVHPLNKAELGNRCVTNGYGIITPRITTKLKSSLKSPFAKLVGGVGSSCAYDTLCSNLYQDTFGEGIFCGKGLIDVNAFYTLCCGFFPSEQILSHDILEGTVLRTAFAGDVEFSDSFPPNSTSYFKRLHRWIRGDFQNISYLAKKIETSDGEISNPFRLLDKFKLFDNIRRAATPINIMLLFYLTFFMNRYNGLTIVLIAALCILIPYIASFLGSIINNGLYSVSRKYYSGVISQTTEIISQGCFALLLLPQLAVISFDAAVRALWRKYVSKKNLLEWTTASQTESGGISLFTKIQLFIIPELLSIALLFSPVYSLRFIALFLSLAPILMIYSDVPYKQKTHLRSPNKELELSSDLAAMWQLYEDYATAEDNFLPPDNVQFAPVFRVCHRTSPTNIGLMMLSVLIARDFDLIDTTGLYKRIDRTLSTIESLEKFNGNLYNWYDTETLKISSNPYVSTVDSGNFCCCMIALKEGLKEYFVEHDGINGLIKRINKLINNTDIGVFFDKSKGLFSIGYNPRENALSPNHYDLLMSEARMTSYFAIAKRLIPKKHWRLLGRTMARMGLYAGPISYSGTMFEFFMPELLLQSETGSLAYEGLKFCIHCQKKRSKDTDVPFGISESGYYAFDNALNYQYKAHGVQKLGLRRNLDSELVVSPYSSYLSLEYDFDSSFANLQELKEYGMYGSYGFFEAIDFTHDRSPKSGNIIKSYMAHHVGMSIVAVSNALHNGKIQKRFFKDNFMKSADELLQEKVLAGAVLFEDIIKKQESPKNSRHESDIEYFDKIYPSQPNVKLLCNGEYTLILTDSGASVALYQGNDVYLRTTDLLRRPQGCYFAVEENESHACLTYLPEYSNSDEMSVEFDNFNASYFSNTKDIHVGMRVHLHNNLPCEIRQFAVKNVSSQQKNVSLLSYIEPVLSKYSDHAAHPAFSRLFLKENYDIENKIIVVSRKSRHSNDEVFCGIGFIEDFELHCNLSREQVLNRPDGVTGVFKNSRNFISNFDSVPDPCAFIKTNISLSPNEQKELNLFILTALSKDELYQNIAKIRHDRTISTLSSSKICSDSIEGRLANSILPQILFKRHDCTQNINAIEKNSLPISALWGLGISGDVPIALVEVNTLAVNERITGYMKCHRILKLCGINFDLVFLFDDKGEYIRPFHSMLSDTINQLGMNESISALGGIHLVDTAELGEETVTLLHAVAVHVAPPSLVRIGTTASEFNPLKIKPVEKIAITPSQQLANGGFEKDSYVINQKTEMPWCNILANPAFGTLLSESSLGFTYAINSRENKLTPWFNDSRSDNRGELLLVKCGEKCYDAVLGSTAVFSSTKAVYCGICDNFESKVTVSVSKTGMCKKIELELIWLSPEKKAEIAFYTEPVLGVSRDNSRMIVFSCENESLIAHNPTNREVNGFMSISSSETPKYYITNREAFLDGNWSESSISSSNEPCATIVFEKELKQNKKYIFEFYLSFGHTLNSSLKMPRLFEEYRIKNENSISINTPDENLNSIFNYWLDWQALSGRIYARTGFSQNSGAWGFRDQLQDSCGCLLKNPSVTKRQIARACTAQFPEGDVLHWWHILPNKIMRGVRTTYSDDLVWLPYTVCEYIDKTDDKNILGVNIAYCTGILLEEGKHEIYGEVRKSEIIESVYSHCKRALDHAYRLGEHNLILMGCGDWNDSFNGVGIGGKGESVWLSEFMIIVLNRFAKLCEAVGDISVMKDYISKAENLTKAVEENCWDGEWYIRAIFDNGMELGSRDCEACQIDSLAQSFAVLSDLPNKERNLIELNSAYTQLVDTKNGIIKLFTPAFSNNELPVGYAASYPRGIRENGGQYTHGSIWLAIALFHAGYREKGFELINILNPANKYKDEATGKIYKNEPYFISADIYTNPQCYGRGGWSIYTGAAAWYYRAIFEWFLGVKIENGGIAFKPNLPKAWNEFDISMKYAETSIHIVVTEGSKDGMFDNDVPFEVLKLDKKKHEVRIIVARQE